MVAFQYQLIVEQMQDDQFNTNSDYWAKNPKKKSFKK